MTLTNEEEIEYFKNELLRMLNIPKEYLDLDFDYRYRDVIGRKYFDFN